jgi:hypothetical protein
MRDEIILEVWLNRDLLAERYNHDLDAIVAAMKKRQRRPLTRAARSRKTDRWLPRRTSGGVGEIVTESRHRKSATDRRYVPQQ